MIGSREAKGTMAGKRGVARGWLARADLGITGKGVRVSMDGFWKRGRASEFARGCSRERARNDWTVSRGGVARGASREGLRARAVNLREIWTDWLFARVESREGTETLWSLVKEMIEQWRKMVQGIGG